MGADKRHRVHTCTFVIHELDIDVTSPRLLPDTVTGQLTIETDVWLVSELMNREGLI